MAIDQKLRDVIVAAAKKTGLPPAGLLAVVEIESNGKALEVDNNTPCLLFERHQFYKRLKEQKPEKLAAAVAAGLTRETWDPATQYKDQGTSRNRLALIARARAIDEDVANQCASWGIGQTMGFNARMIGYASATLMVKAMASLGAQVDGMIAEIKRTHNDDNLRTKKWAEFARIYNGAGFKKNQYDTKLEAADEKWEKALNVNDDRVTPDEAGAETAPETRFPEPPPTPLQSKTIWSTIGQAIAAMGGSVAAFFSADWRVVAVFGVVIVTLAAFIGRDRILKMIDNGV